MTQAGVDPVETPASEASEKTAPGTASDPYAGLDEVARAKRRLLDCAREQEGGEGRRVGLRTALGAFAAGFVVMRFPWLRRTLLGTLLWAGKSACRMALRGGRGEAR